MKKIELISDLRRLADWLESSAIPDDQEIVGGQMFYAMAETKEKFSALTKALGSFQKEATGSYLNANKKIGEIQFQVSAIRENVCQKVVVGHRTVGAEPERYIPAQPAHEEEVVEWMCPESFLNIPTEAPADPQPAEAEANV